jgi:PAS domain S-box-containing protein
LKDEMTESAAMGIADSERAAEALQESEERLRFVAERAEIGYWDWEIEAGRLEWSPLCKRLFGIPKQETMSYARFLEAVHPEDREYTDKAVRACLESGGERDYDIEYRTLWPCGTIRWIHAKGSATFGQNRPLRMAGIALDITSRKEAEEALRRSELRYRHLVEQMSDGLFVADPEWRFIDVNPAGCAQLCMTREEVLSRRITDFILPEEYERLGPEIARYDDGSIHTSEWRLLRKDGSVLVGEVRGRRLPNGNLQGVLRDITERKRAQEHIQLLMSEVNHRSKNMLTLVQAVARQTVAATPEDFLSRFTERLQALSASQDLLVRHGWKGVELDELIRFQLSPFKDLIGSRIDLKGPSLFISASAAQALGMALHELATNAGKYGALSGPTGRVEVFWDLSHGKVNGAAFVMTWREAGGPPVGTPVRRGFGSTVICGLTESSLNGTVELNYDIAGVFWRLMCPAEEIVNAAQPRQH